MSIDDFTEIAFPVVNDLITSTLIVYASCATEKREEFGVYGEINQGFALFDMNRFAFAYLS